jgi:hypothetical protein
LPQALLLWRVWNYVRGENNQATTWEEMRGWLGYLPAPKAPEPEVPDPDEIKRRFEMVYQLHQLTNNNGTEG